MNHREVSGNAGLAGDRGRPQEAGRPATYGRSEEIMNSSPCKAAFTGGWLRHCWNQ